MIRLFFKLVAIAGVTFVTALFVFSSLHPESGTMAYNRDTSDLSQTASPAAAFPASTTTITTLVASTTPRKKAVALATTSLPKKASTAAQNTAQNKVSSVPVPFYSTPPLTEDALNGAARKALVNIICSTTGGILRPISGSGVLIDPRGVVLTNAHVAQYVLLADSNKVNLECVVRTGSPASGDWTAKILYMPSSWVDEHAADITKERPLGTGENDYALLLIDGTIDGKAVPSSFPSIPVENRSTSQAGDPVLLASYPAEFSGSSGATINALAAYSSATTVKQLLTFDDSTADLVSLGGVALAQSGSSGGAVINFWGRLIGIISTTSDGATTAERDLRAITTFYVNRSLIAQTGNGLDALLAGDVSAKAGIFMKDTAPQLSQKIIDQLAH